MSKSVKFFVIPLLAAGMLFTACERKPAVRFAVVSDTHFGHATAREKVSRSLKVLFGKQPAIDALFVVGDLTDNGKVEQYEQFVSVFSDRSLIPEGVALYFMLGNNHDRTREDGKDFFMEKTGQPLRHSVDIKGYPFIAFSEGGGGPNDYNREVGQWLAEAMARAAEQYPGKPVFVFSHEPPLNTCYGSSASEGWGTDLFLPVYNRYPQAVVFGGHSHFPIGDPRSIHQGIFTAVNDGSLYYSEIAPGEVDEGIHPPGHGDVLEGLIVNVMPDGRVEIERWDTFRDEEILPRWVIEAPHDGSRFTYRDRNGLPAPVFDSDAVLTGRADGNAYEVTFPQASDNEVVFKYYIDFLEGDRTVYSFSIFSQFYLNSDMPKQLTRRFSGLPYGKTLTVRVTAADSYDNRSVPLTGETFTVPLHSPDAGVRAPSAIRKVDPEACRDAFSFEARFTAGNERKRISPFETPAGDDTGFEQTEDGRLAFHIRMGRRSGSVRCPVVLRQGQAYHAVATYEKQTGKVRLYVDGAPVGEENVGTDDTPVFPDAPLLLRPEGLDTTFIRMYDRALVHDEIYLLAGNANR
ncbi:MAG: metallophosphoesterase [Tannerella sp.]|jgi:3',5'-cyclic AMP phosphodiesterase CpdA|nr:metallophosphoesterase [Tannerella sp.]